MALTGLDTYHAAVPLKRMAYAKPDLPPREFGGEGTAPGQILDITRTNAG
jgi:hypothetical protein